MFKLTRLIHLDAKAGAEERDAAYAGLKRTGQAHPTIKHALIEWTLPGHINGGDILWHLQFADRAAYEKAKTSPEWAQGVEPALTAPIISHTDFVAYDGGNSGQRTAEPRQNSIYRLAFLSMARELPAKAVARFESDTLAMPLYIKEMRNWQLSRVSESEGLRPWSYVWEQEFGEAADLGLDFTYSPYHWAHVGRWFEPESPEYLIDTCICHVLCETTPDFPILSDAR